MEEQLCEALAQKTGAQIASLRFAGVHTEAVPIYDYLTFADDLRSGVHGP